MGRVVWPHRRTRPARRHRDASSPSIGTRQVRPVRSWPDSHRSRATATRGEQITYSCMKRPGSDACGALAAASGSLERFVVEEFIDFMGRAKISVGDEDAGRSLAEVRAAIIEAEASMAELSRRQYVTHDPQLPAEVFATTIAELTDQLESLRREESAVDQRQADVDTLLEPGSPEAIREWWSTATLAEQRLALSRAMHYITINPARVRGGNVFDTRRVSIAWSAEYYGTVIVDTFLVEAGLMAEDALNVGGES